MSNKIERIEKTSPAPSKQSEKTILGGAVDNMRNGRKKLFKGFMNNRGILVALLLVSIVILIFTSNVNLNSAAEIVELSLVIIIFMACTYSMYINAADSGERAGKNTAMYIEKKNEYEERKKTVIKNRLRTQLNPFCLWYIENELKEAKSFELDAVGISYEEYLKNYNGKDEETIQKNEALSSMEKEAIIKANNIKPIKLMPEMIMKRERGGKRRGPIGLRPDIHKYIHYTSKLFTTIIVSMFTCMLTLEVIANPTWTTFSELAIKLLIIILSGFTGYKMGYENITIYTVNYISDQIDLFDLFDRYLAEKSIIVAEEETTNEKTMEKNEGGV